MEFLKLYLLLLTNKLSHLNVFILEDFLFIFLFPPTNRSCGEIQEIKTSSMVQFTIFEYFSRLFMFCSNKLLFATAISEIKLTFHISPFAF